MRLQVSGWKTFKGFIVQVHFFASLFLSPWRWDCLEIWALLDVMLPLEVICLSCLCWWCDDRTLLFSSSSSPSLGGACTVVLFVSSYILNMRFWTCTFNLSVRQAPLQNQRPKLRPLENHSDNRERAPAPNAYIHFCGKSTRLENRVCVFERCVSVDRQENFLILRLK